MTTSRRRPDPATDSQVSVQGSLALELEPRLDPPEVGTVSTSPGAEVVPVPAPLRRDLERWSRRYLQAAVEIAGGDRPVTQLLRWSTPRVYADLERRAMLVARAAGHQAGQGRRRDLAGRAQVVALHTCFPAPAVAEVSVRIRVGPRFRAVAARFEVVGGRWQCSALEFA